ncbi:PA2169 family four-helix-bundle protein [Sphingobacterium sp. HMA12]|uniref:PA2169 family four-helix-bundle protein n=1 Tax=Sphingobacterium sp. HMA12 TaxID=2050894 RepID=UPI000CE9F6D3|nr:PA2169 family four-helix-bundle protein [Sphingobacterium sp. HMA12]
MENSINNPAIINDIIKINNDRIEGYKKAIELANSHALNTVVPTFEKFIEQSKEFITELTPYVELEGKQPTDSTMLSGKLFRLWMGIKVNIIGDDEKSLLETCEQGEDAFKSAYQTALDEGSDQLSQLVHSLINTQLGKQVEAHNLIKMMRDGKTV